LTSWKQLFLDLIKNKKMTEIVRKRLEWNFGTAIYAFLICFIGMLITVVIKSRSVDHSLVYDDYYDKDIHYQNQYDKLQNYNQNIESNKLAMSYRDRYLDFIFTQDAKDVNGKIFFYRPSDKSMDFVKELNLNDLQTYSIPKDELSTGKWKAKVEWQSNGVDYYKEFEIFI